MLALFQVNYEFYPPSVTSSATSVAGSAVQELDFLPTSGHTHDDEKPLIREIRHVDVSVQEVNS